MPKLKPGTKELERIVCFRLTAEQADEVTRWAAVRRYRFAEYCRRAVLEAAARDAASFAVAGKDAGS